ncbi:PEP-CTERM sorting domain-containing protein [Coraliomargarita sp. W4R53]
MNSIITSLIVSSLFITSNITLNAESIFQDDFSGSPTADLNGSSLDVTVGGQTWRANSNFKADGSLVAEGGHSAAFLDYSLSAGYVYTLSADLTTVTQNWMAFGFVQNTESLSSRHPDAASGIAWALHRDTDAETSDQQVFGGVRANNLVYSSELDSSTITYQLILDATDANNVLFSASINGSSVVTEENLGTLSELNIGGLGFSSSAGAIGSIDNFSLSSVPEPSSFALVGGCLGLVVVLLRRRF